LSFVGLILQPIGFAPDHAIKTIRCHAAKGFSPKLLVTDNWVPIDRGSCNYAWPAGHDVRQSSDRHRPRSALPPLLPFWNRNSRAFA
jgi:hypothetical protein